MLARSAHIYCPRRWLVAGPRMDIYFTLELNNALVQNYAYAKGCCVRYI